MPGTLFVVATTLGNPRDLSPRAADTLRAADLVVAEDTRTARRLLAGLGVEKPLLSCFDANEAARAVRVGEVLREGRTVALVSEAGTPGLSDPGFRIVRAAIEAGARVTPVPGPSAVTAALAASGMPMERFSFVGFPPRAGAARRKLLQQLADSPWTLVLYESPLRAAATLADLANSLGGGRPACLAREITKTHEEFVRGSLAELAERYREKRPLGEVTLVVAGASEAERPGTGAGDEDLQARARSLLDAGRSRRDVAALLHAELGQGGEGGRSRRDLYRLVLDVDNRRR